MSQFHKWWLCLASVGLIAVAPRAMLGQANRLSCEAAVTALREEDHPNRFAGVLAKLQRCPADGPAIVAQVWDTVGDGWRLGPLVRVSGTLYDERMLSALLKVAGDESRPREVRIDAARALVMQVWHCRSFARPQKLTPVGDTMFTLVPFISFSHSSSVEGAIPRTGDVFERVLAAFEHPPRDRDVRAVFSGAAHTMRLIDRSLWACGP